jgi:uncharacterized membrane protein (DUF4010 family)
MPDSEAPWIALAVALGCGLLIGLERERRKGTGPGRAPAGIRTFAIASLAGALAETTGEPLLTAIAAALVAALALVDRRRRPQADPGMTTALALFVTFLLGATATRQPELAGGTAVVVAALLAARSRLHRFSTRELTEAELRDALVLAGAALVVLPLMPDRPLAWLPAINPRTIWRLLVLLLVLQAAGYVALRTFGPRLGLVLGGFVSGFVSSTATIAAMGARARAQPGLAGACAGGALASNLATVAQLAFVMAAISPAMLLRLMPLLLAAGVGAALAALPALRRGAEPMPTDVGERRAFDLARTAGFAGLLGGLTAALAWGAEHVGAQAARAGAALTGFVDVHAAAASLCVMVESGSLPPESASGALLLALVANTVSKGVAALVSGGAAFALRMAPGLAAVPAAAAGAVWLAGLAD